MYKLCVETKDGKIVTSTISLTKEQALTLRSTISTSSRVRNVYLVHDNELYDDNDINILVNTLIYE